jgi:hypothetical protein
VNTASNPFENLIPATLLQQLVEAGQQTELLDSSERLARVKLFDPAGRWTFYVFDAEQGEDLEGRVDFRLYGYCVSPLGEDCDEWGYSSLREIATTTNRLRMPMERDLYFRGVTSAQIEQGVRP